MGSSGATDFFRNWRIFREFGGGVFLNVPSEAPTPTGFPVFQIDSNFHTNPDVNVYFIIQPDNNTK
jgi:hypothetical protein